jgi:hypothetical protein
MQIVHIWPDGFMGLGYPGMDSDCGFADWLLVVAEWVKRNHGRCVQLLTSLCSIPRL